MKKLCFSIFVCSVFCNTVFSSERKGISLRDIQELKKALRARETENAELKKTIVLYQEKIESLNSELQRRISLEDSIERTQQLIDEVLKDNK